MTNDTLKQLEGREPSVYAPEFIPFYPHIAREFKLSYLENLIYGFIRFYTVTTNHYFYFSNEQLGQLFSKQQTIISESVNKLIRVNLIEAEYKVKADGGKVRFIRLTENHKSDLQKSVTLTYTKHQDNKNKKNGNKKNDTNNICPECDEILSYWNEKRGTKYKTGVSFQDNLKFWLQTYSLEEVKTAIDKIEFDNFWKDKMTPAIFFRQMNPRREKVDYIGQFLNMKQTNGFADPDRKKQFESEDLSKYDKYN